MKLQVKIKHLISLIIVLTCYVVEIEGFVHFYSQAGARRCFYRELRQGTLLIGRFKMEIRDPDSDEFQSPRDKLNTGILIDVEEVFNSNHRMVHQRGSSSGQFVYSALEDGEHRICLTPRSFLSKSWYGYSKKDESARLDLRFEEARISIDFVVGDGQIFDVKHKHKVKSLTDQVKRLNDKLTDIRSEQQFIKQKEESFRDLSEETCEGVVRWLIVQLGALFVIGIYQLFKFLRIFSKTKVD
ncbi:uncharacterized protein PRCAT00003060001 [Priceomyces carsonii]|uniref:uncharacterized protein n=1 Tax=Priceomyces carsonii TaxID=28549 RepID=UPI002EDACCDB|nr:unnamed protein product [Priceomyces carsonii]